jgi:hypothetical protein
LKFLPLICRSDNSRLENELKKERVTKLQMVDIKEKEPCVEVYLAKTPQEFCGGGSENLCSPVFQTSDTSHWALAFHFKEYWVLIDGKINTLSSVGSNKICWQQPQQRQTYLCHIIKKRFIGMTHRTTIS